MENLQSYVLADTFRGYNRIAIPLILFAGINTVRLVVLPQGWKKITWKSRNWFISDIGIGSIVIEVLLANYFTYHLEIHE